MGKGKKKRGLDLSSSNKKIKINKSEIFFSLLSITKSRIKKYPYIGVVTMAFGVILFLVSGGANIIDKS